MWLKARFKNYGFWLAAGSLLGIVLKKFGVIKTVDSTWDVFVTAILGLLMAFGIVNCPVDPSRTDNDEQAAKYKQNRDE